MHFFYQATRSKTKSLNVERELTLNFPEGLHMIFKDVAIVQNIFLKKFIYDEIFGFTRASYDQFSCHLFTKSRVLQLHS